MASKLTDYIIRNQAGSEQMRSVYCYGLQIWLEMTVCTIICVAAAAYFQMFLECILFLVIFISLRIFMGGIHLDSFLTCFVCSCIVIIGTLLLAKYIRLPVVVSSGISFLLVFIMAFMKPVNSISHQLDDFEMEYCCRRLKIVSFCLGCFIFALLILNWDKYLSLTAYTLITVMVSAVIGKIKYKIDAKKTGCEEILL